MRLSAPLRSTEQKRRQAIREGFDRLTELVPGLEGQGRSEGLVLKRTVEFMREKIEERRGIVEQIEKAGGEVDEKLKRFVILPYFCFLLLRPFSAFLVMNTLLFGKD